MAIVNLDQIRECFPLFARERISINHDDDKVYVLADGFPFDAERLKAIVGGEVVQSQKVRSVFKGQQCEVVVCH